MAANIAKITDFTGAKHYNQGGEQSQKFFARVQDKPAVG